MAFPSFAYPCQQDHQDHTSQTLAMAPHLSLSSARPSVHTITPARHTSTHMQRPSHIKMYANLATRTHTQLHTRTQCVQTNHATHKLLKHKSRCTQLPYIHQRVDARDRWNPHNCSRALAPHGPTRKNHIAYVLLKLKLVCTYFVKLQLA